MKSRVSRYFSTEKYGALAYIASKKRNLPEFTSNNDIESYCNTTNSHDSYTKIEEAFCFNTKQGDLPFIIVDVGTKYSIIPHAVSTIFKAGYTAIISYEISVSNDKNTWEVISNPPQNVLICPEDTKNKNQCSETVTTVDECKITKAPHRYLRYKVLKDRAEHYATAGYTSNLMRLARIDIYGDLFGMTFRCTNKRSAKLVNVYVLIYFLC